MVQRAAGEYVDRYRRGGCVRLRLVSRGKDFSHTYGVGQQVSHNTHDVREEGGATWARLVLALHTRRPGKSKTGSAHRSVMNCSSSLKRNVGKGNFDRRGQAAASGGSA